MAKSKGPKFYAVAVGRVPGIYNTWAECQKQTTGYGRAVFKSFKTSGEAQSFIQANNSSSSRSSSSATSTSAAASSVSDGNRKRARDNAATGSQQKRRSDPPKKSPPSSNCRVQITIHFDGGSRGNPGVAGAGAEVVVVERSADSAVATSTTTYLARKYCGDKQTNNYAEYHGLLAGLKQAKLCIEQSSSQKVDTAKPLFQLQVYGDSNLIIQQLRGVYECRNANIRPLYVQCVSLIMEMKQLDARSEVLYDHVYREHNKAADALANEAMDRRESWMTTSGDGSDINGSNDNIKPAAKAAVVAGKNNSCVYS